MSSAGGCGPCIYYQLDGAKQLASMDILEIYDAIGRDKDFELLSKKLASIHSNLSTCSVGLLESV